MFHKFRKAPVPGCHQISFPFAQMSHHDGLTISLSSTHFFKTLWEKDRMTGEGLTASLAIESLAFYSKGRCVKDTTGIPLRISLMTQFCCLAWTLHTVALPCLSRDIWPPSKSSSQTSNHFNFNSGGLFPLWRPVTVELSACFPNLVKSIQQWAALNGLKNVNKNTKRILYWGGCSI